MAELPRWEFSGFGLVFRQSPMCFCRNSRAFAAFKTASLILAFILHVIPSPAAVNTSLFESHVWDVNAGLPHNSVTAIAQTSDGFIWIGTLQGVVRFDGVKFTPLTFGGILSNASPQITALSAGPDGSLWIGTRNDGLIEYRSGECKLHSTKTGLVSNSIRHLLVGTEGSLWIGTLNGLTRCKEGHFTHFTQTNGLAADSVRGLYQDRKGTIWIIAGLGAIQLHQFKDGALAQMKIAESILRRNAARAIWVDEAEHLWLGFTSGALMHSEKGPDKFLSKPDGLVDDVVSSFGEDHAGNLWIGTYGGLSRWANGQFVREFNRAGAFFDQINVIFEDREKNIWLGTKTGVYRMTQTLAVTYAREHGLSHNNVMSISEVARGNFWIGTWGGGVNWMRDGDIDHFTQTRHNQIGLTSDFILGMAKENDRQFWFGTDYQGGVFRTTMQNGKPTFTHFGKKEGFTNSITRVAHSDGHCGVWFGTEEGLVVYNNGTFTNYGTKEGLVGSVVRDIVQDKDGSHWIATTEGISHFKEGRFKNLTQADGLSDRDVRALYAEPIENVIWIGTAKGGLNRLKIMGDGSFKITSYTRRVGLWSDEIFDIVDDTRGFLWMSCLKGIFRVSKSELDDLDSGKIKKLPDAPPENRDRILNIQCNGIAKPGAIRAVDGRLFFATVKGVVVIDPNFHRTNTVVPPVIIEQLVADKRQFEVADASNAATSHVIEIAPGRGELEFRFTTLSFQEPERVQFKFKLEGVDEDWREAGNRREASYNNIGPGTYRFRVMACNNDGLWNPNPAMVNVTLRPHFWQTSWFYSLSTIMAVGLVAGVARFATRRRMERKLVLLEQQHALEKERTRIARDMHDEIGARLTQISLLGGLAKRHVNNPSEVQKHIETIGQTARDVVSALDQIVWTMDPRKDTLENFATFLCRYASSFFQDSAIICEFDLPPDMPHCRLETDVRHNLVLAVKEALTNVLKHSGGDHVILQMRVETKRLEIIVSDNGRGFDIHPSSETRLTGRVGNGLGNIAQRLESIGGKYRIESAPGKGTHLFFSMTLPAADQNH
ncbi:MAG: putative two-component system sensor kinase [Verrucomicrobiales bacterium]|nr:putative two-component system sensor kinase [Verrucomicrobiales bacterium]